MPSGQSTESPGAEVETSPIGLGWGAGVPLPEEVSKTLPLSALSPQIIVFCSGRLPPSLREDPGQWDKATRRAGDGTFFPSLVTSSPSLIKNDQSQTETPD